jgi:hypothetical protein
MNALSPFKYADEIPAEYRCGGCGAFGVRLYREYQSFMEHQHLLCTACAEKAGDVPRKADPDHPDQLGGMVAAVPTEDGSTFWGLRLSSGCECEVVARPPGEAVARSPKRVLTWRRN